MKNSVASEFSINQMYEFATEFGRQGGNPDLLQFLIENKTRMNFVVTLGRGNDLPKGYVRTSMILGDDFILPEEVEKAYDFSYSEEQLAHFANTLPGEETIQWLLSNGYMLVPGPNRDLNLFGVRALDRSLFLHKEGVSWFEDKNQTFSRTDLVRGGKWLMLRKGEVPDPRNETWLQDLDRVRAPEYIPNVAEVSYGVTLYYKVRGECLLPNFWVSTSSVLYGYKSAVRVCVGRFDYIRGLNVEGDYLGKLGLSSARTEP